MPFKFHIKIILRGRRLARLGKLMKLQDPGCLQSPKIASPFPKLRRAVTSAGGGAPSDDADRKACKDLQDAASLSNPYPGGAAFSESCVSPPKFTG